jgi:hypothetical protein
MRGIDLSHWNNITDYSKIKDPVILKCTEGLDYVDPTYSVRKSKLNCIGAYCFFRDVDPVKQAEVFVKTAGEVQFYILDFEIHIDNPVYKCNQFLERVEQLTGKKPIIYLNSSLARAYDWDTSYPLWLANYGNNDGTRHLNPDTGKWDNFWMHQYTSRGKVDGIQGNVDLNFMPNEVANHQEPIQNNEIIVQTKPMRYHLYGHMDRNLVRKGDRVIRHTTPIGTIGDGNGQYYAHLHFSISEGLTPEELRAYIKGWTKAKVEKYYRDPKDIDFNAMFGTKMDVGNFGYAYLQWNGYGYHPGVDVNGLKGGNTDFGMPFKSSCDGTVIYEVRTWFKNGGWGNICIIAEN